MHTYFRFYGTVVLLMFGFLGPANADDEAQVRNCLHAAKIAHNIVLDRQAGIPLQDHITHATKYKTADWRKVYRTLAIAVYETPADTEADDFSNHFLSECLLNTYQ